MSSDSLNPETISDSMSDREKSLGRISKLIKGKQMDVRKNMELATFLHRDTHVRMEYRCWISSDRASAEKWKQKILEFLSDTRNEGLNLQDIARNIGYDGAESIFYSYLQELREENKIYTIGNTYYITPERMAWVDGGW